MDKNKKIILLALIIVGILSVGITVVSGGNPFSPYEKQIKLGYKYLKDENYEEAILAFNKAIEIDVKKTKSYIGLAKTYITRLDENAIKDASEALKKGYEQTKSEDIVNSFLENSDKLFNDGKVDEALDLLDKGYEITKDDKLNEKREEVMEQISGNLLKDIFALYENNEIDKIKEIMKTEEYKNISNNTSNENPVIHISNDTGKGVGIYGRYIYLGDYINKKREGNGIWINVANDGQGWSTYTGQWKDDMPNGEGEKIYKHTDGYDKYTGSVVNGLWNGNVELILNNSSKNSIFMVTYTSGIPKVIDTPFKDSNGNTEYPISYSEGGVKLVTNDPKRAEGIFGFLEK